MINKLQKKNKIKVSTMSKEGFCFPPYSFMVI
nr:MAG TPA: hypothetical protein [Caudoviricetes sp.]